MFKISPLVRLGNKNTLCITFFANIFNFYLNLVHIKDASFFFIGRPLCAHGLGEKWGSHRCQRARSSDKRQVTVANLPKPGRHHINDTAIASIFHFGDYKHLTRTPFPFPVVSLCRCVAVLPCLHFPHIEHAVSQSYLPSASWPCHLTIATRAQDFCFHLTVWLWRTF